LEAGIEIGADDTLVELGSANIFHAIECFLVSVIFHKAEAARSLLESIQAHDQAFDLAALGEELVDLLLGGVEGTA
jgi:hypothetical protein